MASKSSFYNSTGVTNTQSNAIDASVDNAEASATASENSANNASASASTATTKASEASTSASTATTKASESASSATASANSATAASNSLSTATTKASEASSSASTALSHKNAAQTAKTAAETAETNAETAETNAASSATAASNSASSASTSASTATTKAGEAATSASTATTKASEAATSASNASTSASTATTKASEASTSANNAASSATAATASKDAALAALDSFDDRYLGVKSSNPSVDNDSNSLVQGTLYFNTTDNTMKVYQGSTWVAAFASISGALLKSGGAMTGAITTNSTFDGRDVATDGTKLDGIEASATADQTKADIEGLGIDVPANNITGTIAAARLSTATTQAESDDSTKIATTAYVVDKITTLIGGAPSTLNDLNELAAAINDDANYNSTLTTALGTKLPLAGGTMTGNLTTPQIEIGNGSAGGTSEILFSDNASGRGKIKYNHGSTPEVLTLETTGTIGLSMDNSQNVSIPNGNLLLSGVAQPTSANSIDLGLNGNEFRSLYVDTSIIASNALSITTGTDLTLDAAGDIILDADGADVRFKDGGTEHLKIFQSSGDVVIASQISDKDMKFNGTDGGSGITALTLDMSDAGTATFNHDIKLPDSGKAIFGAGSDLQIYHDGSHNYIDSGGGNLNIRGANNENAILYTANGNIQLFYDNAKKLETTSSGITVTGTINGGDLRGEAFYMGRDSNDWIGVETTYFNVNLDGAERMRVENDGDVHADGNVIAYSTTISDERLKKDIVKIDNALDKISQLNGYTFEYLADGKKSAGVIAQEVEKVMPSAIVESTLPLKMGDDDKTEYKTVQYDQLHGLMIEAIKELKAEIEELKAR